MSQTSSPWRGRVLSCGCESILGGSGVRCGSFSGSVTLCDRNIQMSSHFKVENLWLESSVYTSSFALGVSSQHRETGEGRCVRMCVAEKKLALFLERQGISWVAGKVHGYLVCGFGLELLLSWPTAWKIGCSSSSEAQEPSVLPRWMPPLWIPKRYSCTFVRVSWSSEAKGKHSPTSLQIDLYQNGFSPFWMRLVHFMGFIFYYGCFSGLVC